MLRRITKLVNSLQVFIDCRVVIGLVSLPARLPVFESVVKVVEVVVHRVVMVPLCQIELQDIHENLERHDNDLEIQVEDKVTLGDTVLFCHHSLFVKDPE